MILALALGLLLFAVFRYSLFFPQVKGIPILMYHKVHETKRDFLTVLEPDFETQLDWLKKQSYQSISMKTFLDFLEGKVKRESLPAKPILFTFDDGYEDNVRLALPLLKKYQFTACLFVTTNYIEIAQANEDPQFMNVGQLQTWVKEGMEVALHSHGHDSYRKLSPAEVEQDILRSRESLAKMNLPVEQALAYPFGARPQEKESLQQLKAVFKKAGIRAAFRIGNRIHAWRSFRSGIDPYEVHRIDVRGDDPFFEFKIKVKKGRSKVF